jgi:hypothetical protein
MGEITPWNCTRREPRRRGGYRWFACDQLVEGQAPSTGGTSNVPENTQLLTMSQLGGDDAFPTDFGGRLSGRFRPFLHEPGTGKVALCSGSRRRYRVGAPSGRRLRIHQELRLCGLLLNIRHAPALLLCRVQVTLNTLKNLPKFRVRKEAHGSISVQKRQLYIRCLHLHTYSMPTYFGAWVLALAQVPKAPGLACAS